MAIGKGLFEFMKQPNIFGGPDTYKNIARDNGMNSRYSQYFQHHENLPFEIFYDEKKEVYIYHFQMLAGNDDTIYDIVIEFTSRDPLVTKEGTIRNYDVRFFSNSPGFAFTYAYVYNKYKLLVPLLKDKFDESYLHVPPKRANPKQAIGYDYTLYMGMRFLQLNAYLLNKSEIRIKGKPLSKFRHQDIATAIEALDSRSGADKNAFKKLAVETKRAMKKVTSPISNAVTNAENRIKKFMTLTKKTPVVKAQKGTVSTVKKAKVSKVIKPRRKH
jgi:hypothetical protein